SFLGAPRPAVSPVAGSVNSGAASPISSFQIGFLIAIRSPSRGLSGGARILREEGHRVGLDAIETSPGCFRRNGHGLPVRTPPWRDFMKKLCALLLFLAVVPIKAQSAPDSEAAAIRQAALDYIEGWYEGDAARMERALLPELAKRIVMTDAASGKSRLDSMSAMTLVQYTRAGGGRKTPKEAQTKDVTILDRNQNAAVVKVVAANWIDSLQVARYNGDWKIINVLWELKPKEPPAAK